MSGSGILVEVPGSDSGTITLHNSSGMMSTTSPSKDENGGGGGGGGNHQFSLVELGKRLLLSAKDGDVDDVRLLISKGAPFTTDWLGISPLHLAAQNGHFDAARVLLQAGLHKDSKTKVDKTPLHIAAAEGHANICDLLLSYGATVDCLDMLSMTPLHWAVQCHRIDAIDTLLSWGADENITSKFKVSALEIASNENRPDIYEMLQNAESFRQTRLQNSAESDARTLAATQSIMDDGAAIDPMDGLGSPQQLQQQAELIFDSPSLNSPGQSNDGIGMKVLEAHGINFLPEDVGGGHLQKTLPEQTLALTDAGKLALNLPQTTRLTTVKRPAPSPVMTPAPPPKIIKIMPSQNNSGNNVMILDQGSLAGASVGTSAVRQPKIITVSREEFESLKKSNGGKLNVKTVPAISSGAKLTTVPKLITTTSGGTTKVIPKVSLAPGTRVITTAGKASTVIDGKNILGARANPQTTYKIMRISSNGKNVITSLPPNTKVITTQNGQIGSKVIKLASARDPAGLIGSKVAVSKVVSTKSVPTSVTVIPAPTKKVITTTVASSPTASPTITLVKAATVVQTSNASEATTTADSDEDKASASEAGAAPTAPSGVPDPETYESMQQQLKKLQQELEQSRLMHNKLLKKMEEEKKSSAAGSSTVQD